MPKIYVKRIECTSQTFPKKDKSGDFVIDETIIVVDVKKNRQEFDKNQALGRKGKIVSGEVELAYQVGETPSAENFFKYGLDALVGKVPCELEVELTQGFDAFDRPVTCVTGVKLPSKTATSQV